MVRTLAPTPDGKKILVEWKDTLVPGKCIKYDEDDREYVRADGMDRYIASQSRGECDVKGQVRFNCKWEPSEILKEQLADHLDCDQSRSDAGSDSGSAAVATATMFRTPASTSPPPGQPVLNPTPTSSQNTTASERPPLPLAREPSVSTLNFDHLPKAHPTKLQFAVTSEVADYGPAVQKLISVNLGKKIVTTTGRAPGIIKRRIKGKRVRPLQFKSWTVNRRNHNINVQDHQNTVALLVHMQGYDVVDPCDRCKAGLGVMQGCVVGEGLGSGQCTNCHYGGTRRACNFRKDSMYRVAYDWQRY